MDKRRLGRTDFELSPIGLGCMQFAQGTGMAGRVYSSLDQATTTSIVGAALAGGVNWFDTAEMYGRGVSERTLTTALKDNGIAPGGVVIATKWAPLLRRAGSIERTIGARQAALQGYPIDLHQIHEPYTSLSTIPPQLRAMARLARRNEIRSVGVSNFSAKQLRQAAALLAEEGVTLASNQVQISLLHRNIERDGVLAAARELGITLIAYSPLNAGVLTGRFHDDPASVRSLSRTRRLMNPHLRSKGLTRTRPVIDELRGLGKAYGVTAAQVALNWVITNYGETVVAIPGASKPHQAEESAGAMSFALTEKERQRLAGLTEHIL
jgi:aryl-alcohol dehydrogenase-like predicted oxidoreductase